MKNTNRILLEQRLAKLLGICIDDDHEYVSDVLDSLIDIGESPEDVAEYLTSFVAAGDNGDDGGQGGVLQFAHDVKRFTGGEEISSTEKMKEHDVAPATSVGAKAKPKILDEAAARREEIKLREMVLREKQREEQDYFKMKKEEEEQQKRREAAAAAKKKKQEEEQQKKASADKKNQKASSQPSVAQSNVNHNQSKGKQKQTPRGDAAKKKQPKSKPAKKQPEEGKPKKKPCGCYGNKHKPLTNCLRCGRISCEKEGIDDYCHSCGYFIQDFSSSQMNTGGGDAKTISAIKHKERLLEFDRTSAARTHVHDDQEDYFVASTSMWATDQEQEDALALEENRQKKLHDRKKQVLNLNF